MMTPMWPIRCCLSSDDLQWWLPRRVENDDPWCVIRDDGRPDHCRYSYTLRVCVEIDGISIPFPDQYLPEWPLIFRWPPTGCYLFPMMVLPFRHFKLPVGIIIVGSFPTYHYWWRKLIWYYIDIDIRWWWWPPLQYIIVLVFPLLLMVFVWRGNYLLRKWWRYYIGNIDDDIIHLMMGRILLMVCWCCDDGPLLIIQAIVIVLPKRLWPLHSSIYSYCPHYWPNDSIVDDGKILTMMMTMTIPTLKWYHCWYCWWR